MAGGNPRGLEGRYATPVEAVKAYRLAAEAKTAKDRVDEAGEKTGLFTGLYAINPITGAKLPLFTADYVLMDYGTGAIMAVPGGDQRDYDFAVKFGLPVIYTVKPLPESGDDLANYEARRRSSPMTHRHQLLYRRDQGQGRFPEPRRPARG
mgnify:CR=1 FL=1